MIESENEPCQQTRRGQHAVGPESRSLGGASSNQPCACVACCQVDNEAPAGFSRRRAVTSLLAGLLYAPTRWVMADDDLLDPSKIGAARKSIAAEGLLDPTRMGATARQSITPPTRLRRTNRQPPSYARNMAESVVSSLNGLTQSAADLADKVLKLDREASELASKLRTLQEEMDRKLGEYRSGLFCSGCNQTKSEILAKGETFPHSGQTIIRPTQEQIAAKERELQAPIDRIARALQENRATQPKALSERDEALLQIDYGLSLWRTSITLENALIWMDENESAAINKSEYDAAESQIGKLRMEFYAPKSPREKEIARDIKMWTGIQEKLDLQRRAARRDSQSALARAAAKAGDEQSKLQSYIVRGSLPQVLTATVQTGPIGVGAGFNDLGGLFRMGSYSLAGHDEVLPSVNSFILAFRNSPQHEAEPAPALAPVQKPKGKLHDLLL